jgi:uncharacterized Tic20 family protein
MYAALAYLAPFAGLTFLGPIVVIVARNRHDYHARFHAFQALTIQGMAVGFTILHFGLGMLTALTQLFLAYRFNLTSPVLSIAMMILDVGSLLAMLGFYVAAFIGHVVGTFRAFSGKSFEFPIAARIARGLAK